MFLRKIYSIPDYKFIRYLKSCIINFYLNFPSFRLVKKRTYFNTFWISDFKHFQNLLQCMPCIYYIFKTVPE